MADLFVMAKKKLAPLVYSPIMHRHALAALKIQDSRPKILDVGGYLSREKYLSPFFDEIDYTCVNVGSAWYRNEHLHCLYDGNTLPFKSGSFPYVISVDSLEHIVATQRAHVVGEIARVAGKRAVIVTPFTQGKVTDEEIFLTYSERFEIEPMPSLAEHVKYGLVTIDELAVYAGNNPYTITFASPRHFYWSIQFAMLINTIALDGDSEHINRRLYEFMEYALQFEDDTLERNEAYRAILTIDKWM